MPLNKYKNDIGTSGQTLIIAAKTGVFYCNQTNGCSCSYNRIEGYIFPFEPLKSKFFDKSFWYSEYGFTKHGVHQLLNKIHMKPFNKETKDSFVELAYSELYNVLHSGSANEAHNDLSKWSYWNDFCCYVEKKLNYIDLKVKREEKNTEAWIHVSTNRGDGILTWDNCD